MKLFFRYRSRGDCYSEKPEAVNKLSKDTCTEENMHFYLPQ